MNEPQAAPEMEPDADIRRRDALLEALLPDVPFDGWTREAMRRAASRIGMDAAELEALFPRGPRDAIVRFSHWADALTLETMAARPPDESGLSARLAEAVRTRLALLAPHREAVRRALSFLALPPNVPLGLKLLYDTVDALWYAAGDRSTDFSFYTKRGTLAGIYAATTLYWLEDRSPDGAPTEEFLARRFAAAQLFPKLRARAARGLATIPNPFRLLRPPRPHF